MQIHIDDNNYQCYIGKQALDNNGVLGTITGVALLPWGYSFVGFTPKGVVWSARHPVLCEGLDSGRVSLKTANKSNTPKEDSTTLTDAENKLKDNRFDKMAYHLYKNMEIERLIKFGFWTNKNGSKGWFYDAQHRYKMKYGL